MSDAVDELQKRTGGCSGQNWAHGLVVQVLLVKEWQGYFSPLLSAAVYTASSDLAAGADRIQTVHKGHFGCNMATSHVSAT